MDKIEANKRLTALETEAKQLREVINADEAVPPTRKPQPGDIWLDDGVEYLIGSEFSMVLTGCNAQFRGDAFSACGFETKDATFRGTLDDVFMRRSDAEYAINEALKAQDRFGASLLGATSIGPSCVMKIRKILQGMLYA